MDKIEAVKYVRGKTGLGIFEVKKALEACNWDKDKAIQHLKNTARVSSKPTGAGAVFSYIHHNKKFGAILELNCATDFVAVNADFLQLGHKLAVQVAALNPKSVEEFLEQDALTDQMKVSELIKLISAAFNEPIVVKRFKYFEVGGE